MRQAHSARTACTLAVLVLLPACAALGSAPADETLQQRDTIAVLDMAGGPLSLTRSETSAFLDAVRAAPGGVLYGLARFARRPTSEERAAMAERGIVVLASAQFHAYYVRVADRGRETVAGLRPELLAAASLRPQDRVYPRLWREALEARRAREGALVDVRVRLFGDRSSDEERELLAQHADVVRPETDHLWTVRARLRDLPDLAQQGGVRWIEEAMAPAQSDLEELRADLGLDNVQSGGGSSGAVTGPAGRSVRVGIFDEGVDQDHGDFILAPPGTPSTNRVVFDAAPPSSHGTAIAGVVAGSGELSTGADSWGQSNVIGYPIPHRWRGVAPLAELLDVRWLKPCSVPTETGLCSVATKSFDELLFEIGALTNDHGMDVSNHAYTVSTDGAYDEVTALHDALARRTTLTLGVSSPAPGTVLSVPPRLHVHSAGNNGQAAGVGSQDGYFSLTAQMKNALIVGLYWSGGGRPGSLGSRGPTHDGRIKPDVVAPGAFVRAPGYCDGTDNPKVNDAVGEAAYHHCGTMPASPRRGYYGMRTGTSLSAAGATGVVALLLETLAGRFTEAPLPSTLRAIVIHTAKDLVSPTPWFEGSDGMPVQGFEGPDFGSGWGLVDAEAAHSVAATEYLVEDEIAAECDVWRRRLFLSGSPFKVTLAWDDPPAAPGAATTAPRLVNDLDLVLIAPGGLRHHPYRLNHADVVDPVTGASLDEDDQTCGDDVRVVRQLTPAADPMAGPDPISPADLVAADRGKDHLNHVEQVVVAGPAGLWTVEVSGFSVPQGPQAFSLVGLPAPNVISIGPDAMCAWILPLCERWPVEALCDRYPALCHGTRRGPPTLPEVTFLEGVLHGRFRAEGDTWAIPLQSLCDGLGTRCRRGEGLEITLRDADSGGTAPIRVTVVDGDGNVIGRSTEGESATIRVRETRSPDRLLLITSATRDPWPADLRVTVRSTATP